MIETESKKDKALKQAQVIIAILAGLATFIVGAYNVKEMMFFKKGPGTVAVYVHSEGAKPIADATVEIAQAQGTIISSTTTDAEGKYASGKLPAGNYALEVSKAGFFPEHVFFSIDPQRATDLNISLKTNTNPLRSAVEEVGASWIKKIGTPREPSSP